jgi:aminopeptidase N
MITVDSWYGIVDITIEEPLPHGVKKRTHVADARAAAKRHDQRQVTASRTGHSSSYDADASSEANGNAESSTMDYEETATHKKLKTRIVGTAKQTNIDTQKAELELKAQLSNAIANFF